MGKKKFKLGFKVAYDAPVTLTFAIVSILLFVLNTYVLKGKLTGLFLAAPTMQGGELPFVVSNPLSYVRMLFYIFGASNSGMLITNLIFILLLGPAMEERYGSIVIGIMMAVSAVFAGVLNACFCQKMLQGAISVVFMIIFLNAFISFSKKKLPLSFIAVFVLFILREILEQNPNGIVGIVAGLAGGLCGSLFAFLTSPKAKAAKKSESSKADKDAYLEELDSQSPRNKKNKKNDDDDDTTVVGTLTF